MRSKYVPLRSCIACGDKTGKQELVRIVKAGEGVVEVDPTGKKAGRGAYLCRRLSCWEKGLDRRRLERVLRGPISSESRQQLLEYGRALVESVS